MNRKWTLLLFAAFGCGNSTTPAPDASTDAAVDATGDVHVEATTEAGVTPCKTGLPTTSTSGVTCGTATCTTSQVCCVDTANCAPSCGNLDLAWACDRSAHCGAGMACCYSFGPSFTTCPALVEATATTCESSAGSSCTEVVCETDTDCMSGQTCYAVMIQLGQDAGRTFGVCR